MQILYFTMLQIIYAPKPKVSEIKKPSEKTLALRMGSKDNRDRAIAEWADCDNIDAVYEKVTSLTWSKFVLNTPLGISTCLIRLEILPKKHKTALRMHIAKVRGFYRRKYPDYVKDERKEDFENDIHIGTAIERIILIIEKVQEILRKDAGADLRTNPDLQTNPDLRTHPDLLKLRKF